MIISNTTCLEELCQVQKKRKVRRVFSKKIKVKAFSRRDIYSKIPDTVKKQDSTVKATISTHHEKIVDREAYRSISKKWEVNVMEGCVESHNIFSLECIIKRAHRSTTCGCGGLRIHRGCANMCGIDLEDNVKLCSFDTFECISDCISCIPCTLCHCLHFEDSQPCLQRDFPVGDTWVFREEKACPNCLSGLLPVHGTGCDVCNFEFSSIMF